MSTLSLRLARGAALIAACSLLGACGLPRSGPNKAEIFAGSVMREGDAFVLIVDDRVNRIASVSPALGFSASLENAAILERFPDKLNRLIVQIFHGRLNHLLAIFKKAAAI